MQRKNIVLATSGRENGSQKHLDSSFFFFVYVWWNDICYVGMFSLAVFVGLDEC